MLRPLLLGNVHKFAAWTARMRNGPWDMAVSSIGNVAGCQATSGQIWCLNHLDGFPFTEAIHNSKLEVIAMSFLFRFAPIWRASLIATAALFATGVANAQSAPAQNLSSSAGYSSSQAGMPQMAELALPDAPAPEPSAAGEGQYGQGDGG